MSLIKKAYFMLNFLNLKSFSIHLFLWVASSLSTLCTAYVIYEWFPSARTEWTIELETSGFVFEGAELRLGCRVLPIIMFC